MSAPSHSFLSCSFFRVLLASIPSTLYISLLFYSSCWLLKTCVVSQLNWISWWILDIGLGIFRFELSFQFYFFLQSLVLLIWKIWINLMKTCSIKSHFSHYLEFELLFGLPIQTEWSRCTCWFGSQSNVMNTHNWYQ